MFLKTQGVTRQSPHTPKAGHILCTPLYFYSTVLHFTALYRTLLYSGCRIVGIRLSMSWCFVQQGQYPIPSSSGRVPVFTVYCLFSHSFHCCVFPPILADFGVAEERSTEIHLYLTVLEIFKPKSAM